MHSINIKKRYLRRNSLREGEGGGKIKKKKKKTSQGSSTLRASSMFTLKV